MSNPAIPPGAAGSFRLDGKVAFVTGGRESRRKRRLHGPEPGGSAGLRRGYWKAIMAIAAKNARMCWAALQLGEGFKVPT